MPHMKPLAFDSVAEDIQERFIHYKNTVCYTWQHSSWFDTGWYNFCYNRCRSKVLQERLVSDCLRNTFYAIWATNTCTWTNLWYVYFYDTDMLLNINYP